MLDGTGPWRVDEIVVDGHHWRLKSGWLALGRERRGRIAWTVVGAVDNDFQPGDATADVELTVAGRTLRGRAIVSLGPAERTDEGAMVQSVQVDGTTALLGRGGQRSAPA